MADDDQQPPEQRYWFPYWTSPPQPPPPAPRPALRPQPSRRDSRPAPLVAPSPSRRPSQPPAATPTAAAAAAASRGAGATSPQAQPQPTRLSSRPSPSLAPPLAPIREPNASAAPAPTAIAKEPKPPTKPATPPHPTAHDVPKQIDITIPQEKIIHEPPADSKPHGKAIEKEKDQKEKKDKEEKEKDHKEKDKAKDHKEKEKDHKEKEKDHKEKEKEIKSKEPLSRHDMHGGKLHKEIKAGVADMVHKLGSSAPSSGHERPAEAGASVITLAGENKGASMKISRAEADGKADAAVGKERRAHKLGVGERKDEAAAGARVAVHPVRDGRPSNLNARSHETNRKRPRETMAPSARGYACLRVLLCFCLALPCLPRRAAAQPGDEAQVLLRIKSEWGDPAPLASWSAANVASHCKWTYVSCDPAGRVTSLSLPNVTLAGAVVPEAIGGLAGLTVLNLHNTSVGGGFPAFLYNLTAITSIDLSRNQLGGELPADIDRLGAGGNLTYLALDHNNFTGIIPVAISKLKSLTYLALNENKLTGTIPPELGELTSLQTLKLELNPFGSGVLPDSFKNLKKLGTAWLSQCNLTGEFPSYVTEMTEMEYLDLSGNAFTGSIPPGIWNLQKLQYLYLFTNSFNGDIVITNGTIGAANLVEVDLSENQLTGTIPESFGSLLNLRLLNLYQNNLYGEIPASIAQLPSLVFLLLWNNSLSGELPAGLGKQTPLLRDIQIDQNNFSGPIPAGICDHRQLWVLTASGNSLNGSIPTSLANCPTLIMLEVQDNELSGEVPAALWTETKLVTVILQNNTQLGGSLPEKLFWNLTILLIDNNRFSGQLPASAVRLQKFHARNNLFSGDISTGFGAGMPLLQELDLSANQLAGAIPESIATVSGLSQMNFSNNQLTGEIPAGLGSMPVLNLLDLSSNQLSGAIPPSLGKLRASQLNMSFNQLTGEVPPALATAYDQSFLGNPGLCTAAPSSGYIMGVRSCAANSSDHVSPRLRAGLLAAGAVLLVVIAAFAFFVVRDIKKRKRLLAQAEEAWKLTPFQPLDFGEASVLRGLSDENLIGKGGSGRVYRVAYTSRSSGGTGGTVAVKRIWTSGKLDKNLEREFASEVDILGHIRHSNIVKLMCCLSSAETKLLVYEYMDNGSLDKWLHGHKWLAVAGNSMARAPSVRRAPLDWPTRVRVAVGTARGLCYMHHECSPPIVHRDVKSSNILLDSELHAKVADFGLARMLVRAGTPDTMSNVAGTFGYMAPECGYTRKVNEKVDVYSFGVVLLELTTGREANDGGEHGSLADWAWRYLQSGKSIADAADKCIRDAGYGDEIEAVFKLGIICTGAQPSTRPTMKDVLQILLRCELAHQKTVDENIAEYDAAPLLQVRGGSRRKQLSDAKGVDNGKGGFDSNV